MAFVVISLFYQRIHDARKVPRAQPSHLQIYKQGHFNKSSLVFGLFFNHLYYTERVCVISFTVYTDPWPKRYALHNVNQHKTTVSFVRKPMSFFPYRRFEYSAFRNWILGPRTYIHCASRIHTSGFWAFLLLQLVS